MTLFEQIVDLKAAVLSKILSYNDAFFSQGRNVIVPHVHLVDPSKLTKACWATVVAICFLIFIIDSKFTFFCQQVNLLIRQGRGYVV